VAERVASSLGQGQVLRVGSPGRPLPEPEMRPGCGKLIVEPSPGIYTSLQKKAGMGMRGMFLRQHDTSDDALLRTIAASGRLAR
jgi:hypothetical protein